MRQPPSTSRPFHRPRALAAAALTLTAFAAANALSIIDTGRSTSKCIGFPFDAYSVYSCFGRQQLLWDGLAWNLAIASTAATATGAVAGYGRALLQPVSR